MAKDDPYKAYCEQRAEAHLFRHLQETQILPEGRAARGDRAFVNFSSNDYLGLSQHPALIARAQDYAVRYGVGAGASRLVTGNGPPYAAIEKRLARGKGYKAALVMNSGYQANLTVLAALSDPEVVGAPVTILADRLCHNSLLQGAVLGGARLIRFRHNNYEHLEENLRRESDKGDRVIIVSESVFGMEGDRADLAALSSLAQRYSAMLYIDEAHATGLFGSNGFGLAAGHAGEIDIAMGTFSKALGSFGAYVACSMALRDYLVQRCGGFIYSTALPPTVLGAMEAALELLPSMEREREYVQRESTNLRDTLRDQGWNCGNSTTQIIPIILGDEEAALSLSEILAKNGILVPAIRPPTVPRGTSRLRLSISAAHRLEDIDRLIVVMSEQAERFAAASAAVLGVLMELVFIHGWGFDGRFWDALSELLPKYKQRRVDLGFFGDAVDAPGSGEPEVLVGHSLGFIHGIKQKQSWHSWVAINSFPRFVRTELQPGCVMGAELRELRAGLTSNSAQAMEAFYERIESYPPVGTPNIEHLRAGLDELRDIDAGNILEGLETKGLVLASRNDPLVPPKVSENLCGLVRNGVLLWNEAGGHTLPMRDPVWCAQAIEDFLA